MPTMDPAFSVRGCVEGFKQHTNTWPTSVGWLTMKATGSLPSILSTNPMGQKLEFVSLSAMAYSTNWGMVTSFDTCMLLMSIRPHWPVLF